MEKIAVLSDIHGNMPALDAVTRDLEQRGIRQLICLGDLVGKGPDSDTSVDRIRALCQTVIRGNWDDFISNPTDNQTLEWHQRKLGEERMNYLKSLPFSVEFYMSGRLIRLFHASPRSVYERIQPGIVWMPEYRYLRLRSIRAAACRRTWQGTEIFIMPTCSILPAKPYLMWAV